MKLSFSTLGCPEWTFDQVLSGAKRFGMDGIEIRGIGPALDNRKIPEFREQSLPGTAAKLQEAGLEIPVIGTSCTFHAPELYQKSIDEGAAAIDLCGRLGSPYIRVFGDTLGSKPEESITQAVRGITELCRYAHKSGVGVLLEIHGEFNTCEVLDKVLEGCAQWEDFGILWDVEHSDRAYGDGWQEFYRLIAPFIRHVHIKDCLRSTSSSPLKLTLPGKGDIPLKDITARLLDDGYNGYFSLEWEKRWVPELPGIEDALACFTSMFGSGGDIYG